MRDGRGEIVSAGDRVRLWGETYCEVVCSFDDRAFSGSFTDAAWGHLDRGVLIETEAGELFHYDEPDEDFEIVRKKVKARTT